MPSKPTPRLIINLTGYSGAGKSTICKYLVDHKGFTLYRPSDAIRHYAKEHNKEIHGNQDYVKYNEELMATDPEALIRPVLEGAELRVCIDGLRAPALMDVLRAEGNAYTIALTAPLEARFERLHGDQTRSGHRTPPTLAAFEADEALDRSNPNPYLPNVEAMVSMANATIDTTKLDIRSVSRQVDGLIQTWLEKLESAQG